MEARNRSTFNDTNYFMLFYFNFTFLLYFVVKSTVNFRM